MPTIEQLMDRWTNEFLYGKDLYSDNYNVRGSAYVGRSKGWLEIEEVDRHRFNSTYSLHKKHKSDTYRYF